MRHIHQSQRADGLRCEDRADVCTKLSTLFTVVRPKARHNHPMIVRGFETADGRTVEHGQFGRFPEVGALDVERQLADVLVGAAAERLLDGAQDVSDGGLAQALVEGVLRYGTGARVALPFDLGVPYTAIGTTGGDALHVGDLLDVRLDELRTVHEATLPVALER